MRIAFDVYEEVRSAPTHFILVPGHREPQHERLLDVGDGYEVVEKTGVAGLVAALETPADCRESISRTPLTRP